MADLFAQSEADDCERRQAGTARDGALARDEGIVVAAAVAEAATARVEGHAGHEEHVEVARLGCVLHCRLSRNVWLRNAPLCAWEGACLLERRQPQHAHICRLLTAHLGHRDLAATREQIFYNWPRVNLRPSIHWQVDGGRGARGERGQSREL